MQTPAKGRASEVSKWLLELIGIDGVLVLIVAVTPVLLRWLFPAESEVGTERFTRVKSAAILIPTIAFVVRGLIGIRQLRGAKATWQYLPFFFGLLVLSFGEMIYVLARNAANANQESILLSACATWLLYALAMAITFFPYKSSDAARRGLVT